MKPLFFLSSIMLLFFLIAKSSANPKIVTAEIMHRACPKTTNDELCETILKNHMGHPLFQTLARVSAMASDQAKSTGKQVQDLYNGIKDKKPALKLSFDYCWQKYSTAASLLTEAKGFLQNGVKKTVKDRALMALSAGIAGDKKMAGQKQYLGKSVASGRRKFRDLCNVLIVLTDEL